MGQENRQSPRIVTEEIVQVHVAPDSTPNSSTKVLSPALFLKAKNISPEGICLETKDFYLPNQLFTLDFEFPHNGSAHAYATVV